MEGAVITAANDTHTAPAKGHDAAYSSCPPRLITGLMVFESISILCSNPMSPSPSSQSHCCPSPSSQSRSPLSHCRCYCPSPSFQSPSPSSQSHCYPSPSFQSPCHQTSALVDYTCRSQSSRSSRCPSHCSPILRSGPAPMVRSRRARRGLPIPFYSTC